MVKTKLFQKTGSLNLATIAIFPCILSIYRLQQFITHRSWPLFLFLFWEYSEIRDSDKLGSLGESMEIRSCPINTCKMSSTWFVSIHIDTSLECWIDKRSDVTLYNDVKCLDSANFTSFKRSRKLWLQNLCH